MLRGWAAAMRPIEVSVDDIAVEAVKAVPPGGHFFGSPHTMTRFEHAFHRPLLSDWRNYDTWKEGGARNATERASDIWRKVLADYTPPPLDPAVDEALQAFVRTRAGSAGDAG